MQLQGSLVPILYGVGHSLGLAYIALQDCGKCFSEAEARDENVSLAIQQQLRNMHLAGFCHGDLGARNIVTLDDHFFFIDLEKTACSSAAGVEEDQAAFTAMNWSS